VTERTYRRVLVLGASSGIAQAVIRRLASQGAQLFLVARSAERLAAVAADARVRGAKEVLTHPQDLDDVDAHPSLLDRAFAALGTVDLTFVAYGVLGTSEDCERDIALTQRVLLTDFAAPALFCQALAMRLVGQGTGTLAVLGSVAGDRGRKSNYAYGGAKGGLAVFLAGLRQRLYRHGVHVLTVKPGWVDTPMTASLRKNALYAKPDRVAGDILRAVEEGEDILYTPGFWRLVMGIVKAIPERIFKRFSL